MKQLKDVQDKVRAAFSGESIRCEIPQVIAGLSLGDTYHGLDMETQSGQKVVLDKQGFSSLVTDHIFAGQFYGLRIMNDPHVSAETKIAILKDRVGAITPEHSAVILKTNTTKQAAGLAITDAVLRADVPIISNWDVVDALTEIKGGLLPDDIQVESSYIQPSGRYMQLRLISKNEWTLRVNDDPYYGALIVENNELTTSFSASSALQKLTCINYSIGQHVADHSVKWGGYTGFRDVLAGGVGKLREAFEFMRGRHESMLGIEVKYPSEFMAMILADLKIKDQKTISAANEQLSGSSMDSVLQAVTYATQHITSRSQLSKWTRRATLEGAVWNALGVNAVNQVNEGVVVDDLYMDDDLRLRDAISAFLKTRSTGYTGEASEALSLSADMVFDVKVSA